MLVSTEGFCNRSWLNLCTEVSSTDNILTTQWIVQNALGMYVILYILNHIIN